MIPIEDATVIERGMEIRSDFSGSNDLLVGGKIGSVIRLAAARLTVCVGNHVYVTILA